MFALLVVAVVLGAAAFAMETLTNDSTPGSLTTQTVITVDLSGALSNDHEHYIAKRSRDGRWEVEVACYAPAFAAKPGAKTVAKGRLDTISALRLNNLLVDTRTWSEPAQSPPPCVDGVFTNVVIQVGSRKRSASQDCQMEGTNGEIAHLVSQVRCPEGSGR